LSYAEITDLLGLPLNTVRSRLFRARMALRDLLRSTASPLRGATPSTPHAMAQISMEKGSSA
jgi:hypothetical protein